MLNDLTYEGNFTMNLTPIVVTIAILALAAFLVWLRPQAATTARSFGDDLRSFGRSVTNTLLILSLGAFLGFWLSSASSTRSTARWLWQKWDSQAPPILAPIATPTAVLTGRDLVVSAFPPEDYSLVVAMDGGDSKGDMGFRVGRVKDFTLPKDAAVIHFQWIKNDGSMSTQWSQVNRTP